jgi:hypothetical protein
MSTIIQMQAWLLLATILCVPLGLGVGAWIGYCHAQARAEDAAYAAQDAAQRIRGPAVRAALMAPGPPTVDQLRAMWDQSGPDTAVIDHRAIEAAPMGEHERRLLMAPLTLPDNYLKPFPADFPCCEELDGHAPAADDPSLTSWTRAHAEELERRIKAMVADTDQFIADLGGGPGGGVTGESGRSGQPPDVVREVSGRDTGGGLPERDTPDERVPGLRVVPVLPNRSHRPRGV